RLIVIDTIRASMVGSEDRSEDVAGYLRAVRRLLAPYPEAGVVLAHHAGWQDGEVKRKRERGSSAFRGNSDVVLYLHVTDQTRELGTADLPLSALKIRDDDKPAPLGLRRVRVTTALVDHYGRPKQTCVIESDARTREDRAAEDAARQRAQETELDDRV